MPSQLSAMLLQIKQMKWTVLYNNRTAIKWLSYVYVLKKSSRHRRCYKLIYEQKTTEIYSTIKCPNRKSTNSNFDYELWINRLRIIAKIEMKEATTTYIQSKFTDSPSYRWYKRKRIFVTPRVVELSMKSICPESITATHYHHAKDQQSSQFDPECHVNAMKCHVIINLSADILLRRLLT